MKCEIEQRKNKPQLLVTQRERRLRRKMEERDGDNRGREVFSRSAEGKQASRIANRKEGKTAQRPFKKPSPCIGRGAKTDVGREEASEKRREAMVREELGKKKKKMVTFAEAKNNTF